MRYTALATCSLLMLTSCAQTFQVQPAPILTQSDMKTILAEYSEEASIQKFYSQDAGARNGRTPEAYRDSIIALYISALDQRYYAWVGDVSKGSKGIDTGTATAALALSSAASLAGVAAAHALAAASSVVSGTGAIVNQKIFFEKTFPALRASMDASRDEVKATIFKKFGSTAQSYTIEMAFADLFEYQEASSLDTAIQRLTTGAALDHQVQATSAAGAGAAGAPAPGGGAPPGPPPAALAIVAPPPPNGPGNPPAVTANAAYRSEIAIAPVSQPQVISGQLAPPPAGSPQCSDGWRITGYYTPREADLPGPATQIQVSNVGSASFSQSFLQAVREEGWGQTNDGWYLGWTGGWTKSPTALDSHGRELKVGMVAADFRLFSKNAQLRLPKAPAPWNGQLFTASDVGQAVTGRHIDVYTGEGTEAKGEANRVTTSTGEVCLVS